MFVSGEAGGGKSRLVAEALRTRGEEGSAAVLVGYCVPDYPVAYEPFLGPLQALTQALEQGPDPVRWEGMRRLLAELVEGRAGAGTEGGQVDRRRHFDGVVSAFVEVCSDRLVVLVVEDVRWATSSTVAFLSFWFGARRGPGFSW